MEIHVNICTSQSNKSISLKKKYLFPASKQSAVSEMCQLLYVQSLTPDDGRKDRPKHVECYSKKINLRH